MRWLDSITDSMDINLSKLQETVKGRGAEVPRRSRTQEEQTHTENTIALTIQTFVGKVMSLFICCLGLL